MKIRFLQPSYEDEFRQRYIKINLKNEPEDYVGGLFVPTRGAVGKIYFMKRNKHIEEKVNENTIYVVKQSKFINTIRILRHELIHFIILKFFKDWQFLQKRLDNINRGK